MVLVGVPRISHSPLPRSPLISASLGTSNVRPCYSNNVDGSTKVNPELIKLNLEWDETSQKAKIRRNLMEVEGTFPVLAQFLVVLIRGSFKHHVAYMLNFYLLLYYIVV